MMDAERYRALLADEIAPEGVEILQAARRIDVDERPKIDPASLRSIVGGYDALIVRSRTHVTADVLAEAGRLKVIGRAGVGVDNIDVDAATRRGIVVLNAPGGNTVSAAEHTMALLLAVVRHIPAAAEALRAGRWERSRFKGIELYGKMLGLVGAGRIGLEMARRARAFGMRVVAYDPYLLPERAAQARVELVTLPDLLESSDVVSVHCPLTEETRGLIGPREIEMMKPDAYLLNVARGGIVDETALAEALRTGRLAGAAFDVFAEEPAPRDHPLLGLENVVAVPHLGAATREAQRSVGIEICEAVRDALMRGDFRSAVNAPELAMEGYAELAPLIDLSRRLGRLVCGLARGSYRSLEVRYLGSRERALRPVAAAAVQGLLSEIVEPPLNLVNALHVARERGIVLQQVALGAGGTTGDYLELELQTAEGRLRVAGTLLAEDRPRISRIGDYHVDIPPRGTLLILKNRDVPGVIGEVGSVLGDAGVNIAEYHQARLEAGGEALAAIAVDGAIERAVIERLADLDEVTRVWQIDLPEADAGALGTWGAQAPALQTP